MQNKLVVSTHFVMHSSEDKFATVFNDVLIPAEKNTSAKVTPYLHAWREVRRNKYHFVGGYKNIARTVEDESVWDEWNSLVVSLLQKHAGLFEQSTHFCSELKSLFSDIPTGYSLRGRLLDIESELGDESDSGLSSKSVFCLLRFLPVLEEKSDLLDFFVDEDTGRIGVSLVERVSDIAKKTLDLQFNENGEISYTFMEGGDGYSRISGTSYLTDYLVNSYKFRKIINIFDF